MRIPLELHCCAYYITSGDWEGADSFYIPAELIILLVSMICLKDKPFQFAPYKQKYKKFKEFKEKKLTPHCFDPWEGELVADADLALRFDQEHCYCLDYTVEGRRPKMKVDSYISSTTEKAIVFYEQKKNVGKDTDYHWKRADGLLTGVPYNLIVTDPGPHVIRISEQLPGLFQAYDDYSPENLVHAHDVPQNRLRMQVPPGCQVYRCASFNPGVYWITVGNATTGEPVMTKFFHVSRTKRGIIDRFSGQNGYGVVMRQYYHNVLMQDAKETDIARLTRMGDSYCLEIFTGKCSVIAPFFFTASALKPYQPCFCFAAYVRNQHCLLPCPRCRDKYDGFWLSFEGQREKIIEAWRANRRIGTLEIICRMLPLPVRMPTFIMPVVGKRL